MMIKRVVVRSVGALALAIPMVAVTTLSAGAQGQFTVTAGLTAKNVFLSHPSYLKGSVSPAAPGQLVYLQQYSGGQWRSVAHHHLTSSSGFRFKLLPKNPGRFTYRIHKPSTGSRAGANSSRHILSVYRWHNLSDLQPVAGSPENDAIEINGTSYLHSLWWDYGYNGNTDSDNVQYNLARKCALLTFVDGLGDNSASDASAEMEVVADGNALLAENVSLGNSHAHSFNVGNYLRLQLGFTSPGTDTYSDNDYYPAYGNARVACRF